MSAIHQFRCNACDTIVDAVWDGNQWLPPFKWVELLDNGVLCGHLCINCNPIGKSHHENEQKIMGMTKSEFVRAWGDAMRKDPDPLPSGTPRLARLLEEIGL